MFNSIFDRKAKSGAVKASVSFKDADGVTHSIKPAVAPTGDLINAEAWAEACAAAGASISSKGKDEAGRSLSKSLSGKECSAKDAQEASAAMFPGVKFRKRSAAADTVVPEPSANGTHTN